MGLQGQAGKEISDSSLGCFTIYVQIVVGVSQGRTASIIRVKSHPRILLVLSDPEDERHHDPSKRPTQRHIPFTRIFYNEVRGSSTSLQCPDNISITSLPLPSTLFQTQHPPQVYLLPTSKVFPLPAMGAC